MKFKLSKELQDNNEVDYGDVETKSMIPIETESLLTSLQVECLFIVLQFIILFYQLHLVN